ncbi:MAG: nucleotidyltransferase family protein [Candidatus Riflebacteria bacterium]|nr:nucleotidyltransferase family protein [Candidatus Riflebacteria bacterium]
MEVGADRVAPGVPAGIILAAGESRRMGGPLKPLLSWHGTSFLLAVAGTLRVAGIQEVVVVLGCRAAEVRCGVDLAGLTVVENRRWPDGMLSSLKSGLAALSARAPGALVTLVDLPGVAPSTCRSLIAAWSRDPGRIVAPRHDGRRGHPVIFPRSLFPRLLAFEDPAGPRGFLDRHPGLVLEIDTDDPGSIRDVDTVEEYEALSKWRRGPRGDV